MQTHRDDDPLHEGVVTDLLDLQARLRGEPATIVWPKVDGAGERTSRIEALRRRLASLELEIEAYERSVGRAPRARQSRDAVVLPFRRRGDHTGAD
jgi:hypothetical protein